MILHIYIIILYIYTQNAILPKKIHVKYITYTLIQFMLYYNLYTAPGLEGSTWWDPCPGESSVGRWFEASLRGEPSLEPGDGWIFGI